MKRLVRDKVPSNSNGVLSPEKLQKEETNDYFKRKVLEEASALFICDDSEQLQVIDIMAEIVDVIKTLAHRLDISWCNVEAYQEELAVKKGRYIMGHVVDMSNADMPENELY